MDDLHPASCRWRPRLPLVTVYRAATRRRFRVILNRYHHHAPIGIAAQVGQRVASLTWARLGHGRRRR